MAEEAEQLRLPSFVLLEEDVGLGPGSAAPRGRGPAPCTGEVLAAVLWRAGVQGASASWCLSTAFEPAGSERCAA